VTVSATDTASRLPSAIPFGDRATLGPSCTAVARALSRAGSSKVKEDNQLAIIPPLG
jgi:hypothetical protein